VEYHSPYESLHHEEQREREARAEAAEDGYHNGFGETRARPAVSRPPDWQKLAEEASLRLTVLVRKRLGIEGDGPVPYVPAEEDDAQTD